MALHSSRSKKDGGAKPNYVTLNKDGKPVWEPGLRAEITARRQPRVQRKQDEGDQGPVSCDLKATLKHPPDGRAAWLDKALAAIPKGKAKAQEVFDIITHRKFVSGVPEDLGQAMLKQVKESLMFFTEKQQLNIAKSKLVRDFKPVDPNRRRRRQDDDSSDGGRSSDEDAAFRPSRRAFAEGDRERRRDDHDPSDARGPPEPTADQEEEWERAREAELPKLSPEERENIERDLAEREEERNRRRDQELKRLEDERKAYEDREKQRKAKIGNAFLMGNEDEDEDPAPPVGRLPTVEKRREDALGSKFDEEPYIGGLRYASGAASSGSAVTAATTSSAIQTMGGDSIVNEAQQILQRGAGVFLAQQAAARGRRSPTPERRRSRSRRRKQRSPSLSQSRSPSPRPRRAGKGGEAKRQGDADRRPGGGDRRPGGAAGAVDDRRRRTYDSLRSPTPDGHLRGQMRAARKAKMMAQMLSQGNVPRVS